VIYYHCTKRKIPCSQKSIEEKKLEAQFETYINNVTYDQYLLDYLVEISKMQDAPKKKDNELEVAYIKKRLTLNEKKQTELLEIKLRKLINDQEYLSKKNNLENEKNELEERFKNTTIDYLEAEKLTIETFTFMAKLRKSFKDGSIEEKKAIIQEIGSNPKMTDKKVLIQAKKPFDIIFNHIKSSCPQNTRFEPQMLGLGKPKNHAFSTACRQWRGLVDEVRTFYYKKNGYSQTRGTCD